MSKIYEALMRAELERAAGSGESPDGSSLAVQELITPVTEQPLTDDPFGEPAQPLSTERFGRIEAPYAPGNRLPFDLSEIATHVWKPSIAAIPSLEERGPAVEQFRSLRSHVTEFREQQPLKTLLISSGMPGEGKSFVTLNLALSFSRHKGNRVLLIDGDMRRGSLHVLLGTSREPGLAEYLSGQADLHQVLQRPAESSSLPPGMSSLVFLPGGRDADKAGDLAANHRFPALIQALQPLFDWIIIDSSPVNLVSDAVSLAHACDGVLLVCREGVTKFKTAQQAQAQFKSANVLGFVLNAVHNLPKGDYYGNYDAYKAEA